MIARSMVDRLPEKCDCPTANLLPHLTFSVAISSRLISGRFEEAANEG